MLVMMVIMALWIKSPKARIPVRLGNDGLQRNKKITFFNLSDLAPAIELEGLTILKGKTTRRG